MKDMSSSNSKDIQPVQSSLISRNITIFDRRTSIRLEPENELYKGKVRR